MCADGKQCINELKCVGEQKHVDEYAEQLMFEDELCTCVDKLIYEPAHAKTYQVQILAILFFLQKITPVIPQKNVKEKILKNLFPKSSYDIFQVPKSPGKEDENTTTDHTVLVSG